MARSLPWVEVSPKYLERVVPSARPKTSELSMALVVPRLSEGTGPLVSLADCRRVIQRSSPTAGSAEAKVAMKIVFRPFVTMRYCVRELTTELEGLVAMEILM